MLDLALDHEYDRRVPQASVGAEQHEEVRESGDRDAVVRLQVLRRELAAVAAGHVERGDGFDHLEAGGVDDHVGRTGRAVGGQDAGLGDPGDVLGDQVDVRPLQGRIVGGGQQDPLAADGVVGGKPGPQSGVGDLVLEVPPAHPLQRGHQLWVHREAERPGLHHQVDGVAARAGGQRNRVEGGPQPGRDRHVRPGMDPRRRPLEHGQVCGLLGDFRDELDRGRAGPDHRDPLTAQIAGLIPARRVKRGAAEPFGPRKVRVGGQVQRTRGGYHGPRLVAAHFAVLNGHDGPAPGTVVPVHPLHRAPVADVLVHAVLVGARPQVVPDLLLRREEPAPVRVQLEGVGVKRRRHVARATRVLVVAPGPAEIIALVQDHEIVESRLLQRDPHPDAAEPRSHYHDPWHVWTITQDSALGHAAALGHLPGSRANFSRPGLTGPRHSTVGVTPRSASHTDHSRLFVRIFYFVRLYSGIHEVISLVCLIEIKTISSERAVVHALGTGSSGPRAGRRSRRGRP